MPWYHYKELRIKFPNINLDMYLLFFQVSKLIESKFYLYEYIYTDLEGNQTTVVCSLPPSY